jgi:hypothetical protein
MADGLEIVPALPRHVGYLARHMREIDRTECRAMGATQRRHCGPASRQARGHGQHCSMGSPAMFGVVIESILTGEAIPWFWGPMRFTGMAARCWPSGRRFLPRCTMHA